MVSSSYAGPDAPFLHLELRLGFCAKKHELIFCLSETGGGGVPGIIFVSKVGKMSLCLKIKISAEITSWE